MIVDLPSTSTTDVSKTLVRMRNEVGAMAMGRVLTLLVAVAEDEADSAIEAANGATRQHPARIVVVVPGNHRGSSRLDAQIRVGGDAGASEIVVLRLFGPLAAHGDAVAVPLLLPDSPVVAWWPGTPEADVAGSALGSLARRRITDAAAADRPSTQLRRRATHYRPGDTDLAWTRITRWRAVLAAALDANAMEPIHHVTVTGEAGMPSADLLAGWLGLALGAPVTRARSAAGTGLVSVRLQRESGPVDLVRAPEGQGKTATLAQPGQPVRVVTVHEPTLAESLADELRRLDADQVYAAALQDGLPLTGRGSMTQTAAIRRGLAPDGPAASPERRTSGSRGSRAVARARPNHGAAGADVVSTAIQRRLADLDTTEHEVRADRGELADAVAAALVREVEHAVAQRGVAHVALTGGSMGGATMRALRAHLGSAAASGSSWDGERPDPDRWSQVHLWWGDERFVPSADAERNDRQADEAGLGDLGVPAAQVHRVAASDAGLTLEQAAQAYAVELATWAGVGRSVPAFDVLMLGVGPDGHVASLFPDRPELELDGASTAPVTGSPKPPPERVTLTLPALRAARSVWFLVAGADKADAVQAVHGCARADTRLPASCVRGRVRTLWWLDEAAAARLPGD